MFLLLSPLAGVMKPRTPWRVVVQPMYTLFALSLVYLSMTCETINIASYFNVEMDKVSMYLS